MELNCTGDESLEEIVRQVRQEKSEFAKEMKQTKSRLNDLLVHPDALLQRFRGSEASQTTSKRKALSQKNAPNALEPLDPQAFCFDALQKLHNQFGDVLQLYKNLNDPSDPRFSSLSKDQRAAVLSQFRSLFGDMQQRLSSIAFSPANFSSF